MRVGTE